MVIVGDRDVMVVDTGTSPAAARAMLEDLTLITDRPVRYVVNTHFHYDHTDGNQVYAGKADIIAHEYVKYAIEKLDVLHREPFKTSQLTDRVGRRSAGARRTVQGEIARHGVSKLFDRPDEAVDGDQEARSVSRRCGPARGSHLAQGRFPAAPAARRGYSRGSALL